MKGAIEMKKLSDVRELIELVKNDLDNAGEILITDDKRIETLNESIEMIKSIQKSVIEELDLIEFGINEVRNGLNSIENFTYLILPEIVKAIRSKINP